MSVTSEGPKNNVNMPVVWLMVAGVSDSVNASWMTLGEAFGFLFEGFVGAGFGEELDGGCSSGHGYGVAGEGAGLVHGSEGCDVGHEFSAGAVCSDGEAAADDLAEAGDVGVDAVEGLRAAVGHSEAGDYFVED